MNQLLIRDASKEDIPLIVQIEKKSFSTPWSEFSFVEEIHKSNSKLRVAALNGIVIGYICIEQTLDEAHILNLAVHPEYRRMGIASAMVGHAIDDLKIRACRYIYLEVRASNYGAHRLYARFGFKTIGMRKGYYIGPAEDAEVMMLEI